MRAALLLLILTTFLFSCKSDVDNSLPVDVHSLPGKWTIYEAFREGEPTKSLDRAVMEFHGTDSLSSNLFSNGVKVPFDLKDNHLHVPTKASDYVFSVRMEGSDTLKLSGQVGISQMSMHFFRN